MINIPDYIDDLETAEEIGKLIVQDLNLKKVPAPEDWEGEKREWYRLGNFDYPLEGIARRMHRFIQQEILNIQVKREVKNKK